KGLVHLCTPSSWHDNGESGDFVPGRTPSHGKDRGEVGAWEPVGLQCLLMVGRWEITSARLRSSSEAICSFQNASAARLSCSHWRVANWLSSILASRPPPRRRYCAASFAEWVCSMAGLPWLTGRNRWLGSIG